MKGSRDAAAQGVSGGTSPLRSRVYPTARVHWPPVLCMSVFALLHYSIGWSPKTPVMQSLGNRELRDWPSLFWVFCPQVQTTPAILTSEIQVRVAKHPL